MKVDFIPKRQTFIKDESLVDEIHETGFSVIGNIGDELLAELRTFYTSLHNIRTSDGAMFYSIYSTDLAYRKNVHSSIHQILLPFFEKHFKNYKNVINSFIVKKNGRKSEFALHQDSTIIDESRFSQLSLWIPLQDTNVDNGTLCLVPKTHRIYAPYRSVTVTPFYAAYEDTIRKYLFPLDLKAGDVLAFDYRLVHYSPANITNDERVVVMAGIFDENADFRICYKEPESGNIEIYSQDEDYLLTNKGFHLACDCQPETGEKVEEITDIPAPVTKDQFLEFIAQNGVQEMSHPALQNLSLNSYTVIDAKYKSNLKEQLKDKFDKLFK